MSKPSRLQLTDLFSKFSTLADVDHFNPVLFSAALSHIIHQVSHQDLT